MRGNIGRVAVTAAIFMGLAASCGDDATSFVDGPSADSGSGDERATSANDSSTAPDGSTTDFDATPPPFPIEDASVPDIGTPDAASICVGCKVDRLALGTDHSCALMDNGTVACWGDNGRGQLGDGKGGGSSCYPLTCGNPFSAWPVLVSGLTDAIAIGTGAYHTCAVRSNGAVACWGLEEDASGNWQKVRTAPGAIANITDAVRTAGGFAHNCVVRSGGNVTCWGVARYGKLGVASAETPPSVVGVGGAIDIAAGRDHSCRARDGRRCEVLGLQQARRSRGRSRRRRRTESRRRRRSERRRRHLGEGRVPRRARVHLRRRERRRREVLGHEQLRNRKRRAHADGGGGLDRCEGGRGHGCERLRASCRRRSRLLAEERVHSTDDVGSGRRRGASRIGRRPLLRAPHQRRGLVLGQQPLRSARQRRTQRVRHVLR